HRQLGISRLTESAMGLRDAGDTQSLVSTRASRCQTKCQRSSSSGPGDRTCSRMVASIASITSWPSTSLSARPCAPATCGSRDRSCIALSKRTCRDPMIKLYTHISDRYAPFHVKVITGTSGEAIHILDGLVNHDSAIDILAHHTDGGGLSDHVFAIM